MLGVDIITTLHEYTSFTIIIIISVLDLDSWKQIETKCYL